MEINVDYLGVRMIDLSGAILGQEVRDGDFRGSDPAQVVAELVGLYRTVTGSAERAVRIAGAGLAVPGLVDRTAGPVRLAPNLGWRDVDVAALFRAELDTTDGGPLAMLGGPQATRLVTSADGQQMQITVDPATGQQMALPAPGSDGLEAKIDIARIEGQVKASSVKRVAEFVDKHPEESVSIIRSWLHESA